LDQEDVPCRTPGPVRAWIAVVAVVVVFSVVVRPQGHKSGPGGPGQGEDGVKVRVRSLVLWVKPGQRPNVSL